MPEITLEKIDDSHDRIYFDHASTTQEQKSLRVFPDPIPPTHELRVRWVNHLLRDGKPDTRRPRRCIVECVLKTAMVAPAPEPGEPVKPTEKPIPPEIVARIEKLNEKDRETMAGEYGVNVFDKPGGKKISKALLVARLADAVAEKEQVHAQA